MTYTPTKWVNGGKPAINAENLNKIEEALAQLSVPDITETTSTTQPNSHAGRENILEIGGVTEQDSTAGNQLWNGKYVTSALNKEQDNFVADSTMAGNLAMPVTVGKQYSLSINGTLASMRYAFLDTDGNTVTSLSNASTTVVAPENAVYMVWRVNGYHAETDEVMLNEGTTALPYEKYTGGIPAPNPFYPMEIKKSVVSGVKTYGGENFHDGTLYEGIYSDVNFNMYQANYGVFKSFKMHLTRGMYTLMVAKKINLNRLIVDGNFKEEVTQGIQSYTFTATKDGMVGFTFRDATSSTTVWDESTFIGVFKTSSHTFSQPIELYGIGDVQDVITPKEIDVRCKKVKLKDFTFKQNSQTESGAYEYYASITSDRPVTTKGLCTHFKVMENSNVSWESLKAGEMLLISNTLVVAIDIATLDEFNEFISTNDVELVYRLITPTTEALPIADQIGLNSLATYDGITYVEFDSEIYPTFKAEYGTSKVGGYTLEAMLAGRNGELRG